MIHFLYILSASLLCLLPFVLVETTVLTTSFRNHVFSKPFFSETPTENHYSAILLHPISLTIIGIPVLIKILCPKIIWNVFCMSKGGNPKNIKTEILAYLWYNIQCLNLSYAYWMILVWFGVFYTKNNLFFFWQNNYFPCSDSLGWVCMCM